MKNQNVFGFIKLLFLYSFQLSLLGTSLFIQKVNAQEIEASNLACTGKLKNYLGQEVPEYCRSAEADAGILIDSLTAERQKDNSTKLQLTLFNRGTADGLVEVYNLSGKLVDLNIIKGNKPPTGLIQSGSDLFLKYPQTFWSRYPLGDVRRELEEQKITVIIPQGGFINLTKSSGIAILYNTAFLTLEISQIKGGDPKFFEKESVRQFLLGFAKETASDSVKNIFKSDPTTQAIFSLDFIDANKTAEILQSIWEYSLNQKDNPLLEAFIEISSTAGNIGIENALDTYILPGLGTLARTVRQGGDAVNTFALAADTHNALQSGSKGTITLRDIKSVQNSSSSNSNFQNHWASVYIQALAAKGIFNGFPTPSLNPDARITRAQFAFIVARAFNPSPKRAPISFRDVNSNDWASQEIKTAFQGQFISAYPDYTFKPEATIPRVNCLVSLVGALGLNLESSNQQIIKFYKDANQIPNYAIASVATATQNQLIVNYPNPRQLNPNQEATLGEVSAFVYQSLVHIGKAKPINSDYIAK